MTKNIIIIEKFLMKIKINFKLNLKNNKRKKIPKAYDSLKNKFTITSKICNY